MKKNIYYKIIIITLFIVIIFLCAYLLKEKKDNNIKTELNNNYLDYSNFYFMTNPIDEYFMKIFNEATLSEIEIRNYQEEYLKIWKNVYNEIMTIIQKKCIYDEDIQRYNDFIKGINDSYDYIKPLLLAEMLDNYKIPESPEKLSYGTGTTDKLKMYQGMIYRNACLLFIPYLEDEYNFPNKQDIDSIIKKQLED